MPDFVARALTVALARYMGDERRLLEEDAQAGPQPLVSEWIHTVHRSHFYKKAAALNIISNAMSIREVLEETSKLAGFMTAITMGAVLTTLPEDTELGIPCPQVAEYDNFPAFGNTYLRCTVPRNTVLNPVKEVGITFCDTGELALCVCAESKTTWPDQRKRDAWYVISHGDVAWHDSRSPQLPTGPF